MITREFLTAGRAIFTVSNPKGERYTFKVLKHRGITNLFRVFLLDGPDNESSYETLCGLRSFGNDLRVEKHYRAPTWAEGSTPWKVFTWVIGKVGLRIALPPGYSVQHAGRCGRCGRLLTVPESIESGLGPECVKKGR